MRVQLILIGEEEKEDKKIKQHDHHIGYWVSGREGVGRFEPLTTFGLRLLSRQGSQEATE